MYSTTPRGQTKEADANINLPRDTSSNIVLQQTTLKYAVSKGDVMLEVAEGKLEERVHYTDNFEFCFPSVTPWMLP